jgi:hypothetical protein
MITIEKMLSDRAADVEDAVKIFDGLEPVTLDFMIGRWKGYEIATGHAMDGLLEPTGWYGKNGVFEFDEVEEGFHFKNNQGHRRRSRASMPK